MVNRIASGLFWLKSYQSDRFWLTLSCIRVLFFIVLFGGLCSCSKHAENVKLYDTGGSQNERDWKEIHGRGYAFASPEHIVFENTQFRVTYPILRKDQQAGHSYFVKVDNEWLRVTGSDYGDYIYFIDSIVRPPEDIRIIENSPEQVTLSFHYQHKNYRADGALNWAYDGDIALTKIMTMKKQYPGVFVKLKSVPPNPNGEREVGFGGTSPLVFSERVVAQHPISGRHIDLELLEARRSYAVSLPLSDSFYRLLVLSGPMPTFSYQFNPQKAGGMLTVNRLIENDSDQYHVFLGAVPFDSSRTCLECEGLLFFQGLADG